MVTWQLVAEPWPGHSPCDPEYRQAFSYIKKNHTARLRARDSWLIKITRWIAINPPKARMWPHLSTTRCRVVKSLTSELLRKRNSGVRRGLPNSWATNDLASTLKPMAYDLSKCCFLYLRFLQAWPSMVPPIFDSWVCPHFFLYAYLFSPEPQRIHSKQGFFWSFMTWRFEGFFLPFSGSPHIPPSLSRAKQEFFLVYSLGSFFLVSQSLGWASSPTWGFSYHSKGAR